MPVAKNLTPTKEEVDDVHRQYVKELVKLFDENKGKYGVAEDVSLEII